MLHRVVDEEIQSYPAVLTLDSVIILAIVTDVTNKRGIY